MDPLASADGRRGGDAVGELAPEPCTGVAVATGEVGDWRGEAEGGGLSAGTVVSRLPAVVFCLRRGRGWTGGGAWAGIVDTMTSGDAGTVRERDPAIDAVVVVVHADCGCSDLREDAVLRACASVVG